MLRICTHGEWLTFLEFLLYFWTCPNPLPHSILQKKKKKRNPVATWLSPLEKEENEGVLTKKPRAPQQPRALSGRAETASRIVGFEQ